MKKCFFKLLLLILLCPIIVLAKKTIDNEIEYNFNDNIIAVTERYYKTIMYIDNVSYHTTNYLDGKNLFYTEEVTKEEYENASLGNISIQSNGGYVETTYKKLTSSISKSGANYVYTANLEWKNMPSTRSYDIIAIGFHSSVKAVSKSFSMKYCLNNGKCNTSSTHYSKILSTGVGASFKIPSDSDLSSLNITLSAVIQKNVSETITKQLAVADYSHAISSVSAVASQDYNVGVNGITLGGSLPSSYDSINAAELQISCNW